MYSHGLQHLATLTYEGGASEFVDDLLIALSDCGVRELRTSPEGSRPLHEALCIINRHTSKMLKNSRDVRADSVKRDGYMRIGDAVAISNIGAFDYFWHYVRHSYAASWCSDGRYLMTYSLPHARHILENDFEKWYRKLVCGYAKLIQRKIYGR